MQYGPWSKLPRGSNSPGWPHYFFNRSHPLRWPKLLDCICRSTHHRIMLQAFCFLIPQTHRRCGSNNSAYKPMSVRRQAYEINWWQTYNCSYDTAITLILLPIMLFRNALNFDQLCLSWTPIMPKLVHNFLYADVDWPLFHFSWWIQYECQYVCYGLLNLSKHETMSRWQVHVELPAYVEIIFTASHRQVPSLAL